MPPKKDNLPINVDVDLQNGGSITYANEVIAIIAGVAANEIDGIAGMCTSGGLGDIISRNRNITRGVRVEIGSEEASVDLYIIVEYGYPIQKVSGEVQENVRKAIETMTGLHVVRVDVHVQGVSFEKEKNEQKAGLAAAQTAMLNTPAEEKKAEPESQAEPEPAPQEEAAPEAAEEAEEEPEISETAAEEAAEPAPQAETEQIAEPELEAETPVAPETPEETVQETPEKPAKPLKARKRA